MTKPQVRGGLRSGWIWIELVELRGFEPLTFSLRTRRATNCATAPERRAYRREGTRYHLHRVLLESGADCPLALDVGLDGRLLGRLRRLGGTRTHVVGSEPGVLGGAS